MPISPTAIATVGDIAQRNNVPPHRVEYVVKTRGIQPWSRAGNARLFDEASIAVISAELKRIKTLQETKRRAQS